MVPLNNYSSISIFVTPVSIRYMWYITTCLSKCYLFSVIKMCSIKIECTFEDTFKISKQCEKTLFTYIIYVCIDSLIVVYLKSRWKQCLHIQDKAIYGCYQRSSNCLSYRNTFISMPQVLLGCVFLSQFHVFCIIDRCLSFICLPLCCLTFCDLRILIVPGIFKLFL